ncbi:MULTISPECIES: LytR C-terminal domain-containing protein [Actinoplanes]|uniref:LytR/CpsA/Psr regulator C-terminal domain-containing protein n=2 Tax=Actinoplanes TaxID=1865 RepID=A0A0X3UNZ9_9ACTN|nr:MULTISPECIES: LytR C-terminal domain-containing protein [Actinoplanes]KUL34220.1 hypothetical protein ADL15_16405 [Actinoplanes awajinensis subsp. mycoplanecinus]GIE73895.1 hypothetical protein Apa02nite_100030 [Actinoplanes palleronii]
MSYARIRAYLVIGFLAVAAIIVVVVSLVRDTQGTAAADDCPAGAVRVNLTLPDEPSEVKIRVLNGTKTAGLADQVTADFKGRGFVVQKPGKSKTKVKQVAVIQFGPKTVGAAQWIRAFFLGQAEPVFVPTRTTDVIDVLVGDQYRQLATFTEVNQSMAQISSPSLPPGTCTV